MTRALARQQLAGEERGALLAVVADLTEATKVFREETYPEMFAIVNQHLALAYLVMPMCDQGDRMRVGVAVNALRAALRVYTPRPIRCVGHHSAESGQRSAVPAQRAPGEQPGRGRAAVRGGAGVPRPRERSVGYARILANQGNALGHLGAFADARERLDRARASSSSR